MRRVLLFIALCSTSLLAEAQALMGTTGLLHAPSAEMQRDKTVMIGGNYLDTHPLSTHFKSSEVSYTFNYYVNATFFPWLEVAYTCTLVHADHGSTYFPEDNWGEFCNQDRAFYVRLRLWKEGWWKPWTPQIVLGWDDALTHDHYGGGGLSSGNEEGNNNYNTRYYLAVTKHFDFQGIGELGVHAAFVYAKGMGMHHYKRPSLGVNFRPNLLKDDFWSKAANGFNVIAEYDAYSVNVGTHYSFWKDYINAVIELNQCKHFSAGIYFKIHLK